jgi:hypothetical protein
MTSRKRKSSSAIPGIREVRPTGRDLGRRHLAQPCTFACIARVPMEYADFLKYANPRARQPDAMVNSTLEMEYYLWRNLGFALEYSANNLDLKAEKASWEGRARKRFYGPSAFVRLRF